MTFGLSALLIAIGVRRRPAPAAASGAELQLPGLDLGRRQAGRPEPEAAYAAGFSWLLGLYVVPEGVAPPYAHSLGAGSAGIGLLMAAGPAGTALGTYLFLRLVPAESRPGWMPALAMAGGLPLVACWLHPGIAVSIALWGLSGAAAAYQVQVVAEYVRAVPDNRRAQAIGVAASGLLAAQGIGILLGGLVASRFGAACGGRPGRRGGGGTGGVVHRALEQDRLDRADRRRPPQLGGKPCRRSGTSRG